MTQPNEYSAAVDQFLVREQQPAQPNVQAGLALAADANPDYEAELRKLSAKTGVPLETARNMEKDVRRQAFIQDANPSLLTTQYPKVAEFLANPDNAAVAKDDIGVLQKVSDLWGSLTSGVSRSTLQDELGGLHYRSMVGQLAPSEEAQRQALKGRMQIMGQRDDKRNGFEWALNLAGYTGGQVVSSIREGATGAMIGAAAGAGVGSAVPGIGTVAGAGVGARVGLVGGTVVYNYKQEAGFAFDEFSDFKAADGAKLDRATAQGAAAAVGLLNAGLETVADLTMARMVPGMDKLLSMGGKAAVKQLLTRPTFRAKIAKAGQRWLTAATTEGVTEALQEVVTIVGGELAQAGSGVQDAAPKQPVLERVATAGRDAFVGALGFGAGGAAYQGARGYRQAAAAQQSEQFMTALGEAATESKLLQRLPEKWREMIAKVKEGGPVENVYIPVEQFNTYFQTAGVDPADVALEIGAINYREALAAGSDVAIPLEDYATHIAPTPHHQQLMQDVRLFQGQETPRERADFEKNREDIIARLTEQGEVEVDEQAPAYTQIREAMMGELVGRYDRSAAETNATLYAKGIMNLAAKTGIDPLALHERYGLSVKVPLPKALQRGDRSDITIDPLIDRLRAGDIPSDELIFGERLSDFVRGKGGLKDEGGDVRGMDADKGKRPFQRNLIQPGGLSYDAMLQAAAEAGYLSGDSLPADFLNLLDADVQGSPVYAPGSHDAKAQELRATLDSLGEWLNTIGADLGALSNEQVRQLMERASGEMSDAVGQFDQTEQQAGAGDKRGFIQFGADRKFSITLLEKANMSTFVHELGHFWLEVMGDLAQAEGASQQVRDDYATVLQWLGAESREAITVDMHEKLARGHEAYLMEGKAPSSELRAVFQRFKAWLSLIYQRLSLNVKLNDEVRGVFDRIYASDAEIEEAAREMRIMQMFTTAAEMGVSQGEFDAYAKATRAEIEDGKDELQAKLMREFMRKNQAWYKDVREKVRAEVEAETSAQPVYLAFEALIAGAGGVKLNKQELLDRYGADYMKRLPRGFQRIYSAEGGMSADMAAEVLGFQSGDELVEALVNMRPKREVIEAETQARIDSQLGNMLRDGSMYDEAVAALHNEKRAEVLAIELRALHRKQREVRPILAAAERERTAGRADMRDSIPPAHAFRDAAAGMIGQKRVRDLTPHTYLLAEKKAGREAFEAASKSDWQVAAAAKQRELLNHHLYREALKAQEAVEKAVDYAKSLEKKGAQERIGKAGESYLTAINAVLDAYEFRKVSNKALDVREQVRAAMAAAEAEGEIIDVMTDEAGNITDPALLTVRNFRELSVDELAAIYDTLRNIAHVANEARTFRSAEVKASYDDIASQALVEIADGVPDKEVPKRSMRDPKAERLRAIVGIPQSWRGLYSYISEAVGFKENSTLWNYVVRPLNDAAAREAVMLKEAADKMADLFKRYETTYLYGKGRVIPGVGPLNKQEQLMIAASYGTETGRQRLRDNGINGTGFSQQELDMIINSLDERDWQFVQELWRLFDSYWQQIEDKQQRVTGVRPEKVSPVSFQTQFGVMPGGYSPIAYEGRINNEAAEHEALQIANEMKKAAFTRSTTRRGFTQGRVDRITGRAVRYDFGLVYKHINEVIHDLTHHEALRDVQKLLNHKVGGTSILGEITRRMGDGVRDQIRGTLEEIAVGDLRVMGHDERLFERLAKGASMASMAYNVWNAVQNATGIFNSMSVIGAGNFIGGAARWAGSPKHMLETIEEVHAKSEFMQTRFLNMNRDVNAMRGKLEQMTGKPVVDNVLEAYQAGGFWMLVRMQQIVDVPTWLGAYHSAKRSDANMTEANAVALADQAVINAQGGGRTVDLSKFMRGKGWARVWTVFAGYFNVTYQRTVEAMKRARVDDYSPAAIGRAVTDIGFLMAAPALMTTMMKEAIDVLVGDDDEDKDSFFVKYLKEQFSYILAMFPYVRETAAGLLGYGTYSGPVGARFFKDLNDLARQLMQGDADENLGKAAVKAAGTPLGLPTGQILKTYEGAKALADGNATPLALVFGPPKKD